MSNFYSGNLPQLTGRNFDVVYITPEILLAPEIRSGAGGLGVVAGSFMNEIETNHHAFKHSALAISFYCSHGYQTQIVRRVDGDGMMESTYERDYYPEYCEDTGERIVLTLAGRQCHVALRMPRDRERKHTAVILLDTDLEENDEDFRMITRVLYGEKHATAHFSPTHEPWRDINWLRVLQAAVLGLGAYEVLRKYFITYRVVHLNESHPVFFLIRAFGEEVRKSQGVEHALNNVRALSRFTNHTILESGNKWYANSTIMDVAGHYPGFDGRTLAFLVGENQRNMSMTETALYLVGPGNANGVSEHHADIANRIWPGYNIMPITNGVSVRDYQHREFALLDRAHQIPDLKRHLKAQIYADLRDRAREAGYHITVPEERVLGSVFAVWARRCQSYKRPGLMWHDEEFGLVRTLLKWGWITVAWGGYVHPDDTDMANVWNKYFRRFTELEGVIPVFNYRLDLMRPLLKSAADIWLNTPQYGHEACGTSWMSAMLNCALVVSIADGGVREAKKVVTFGSTEYGNWNSQYMYDARSLWETLVTHIVKLRERDPNMLAMLFEAKREAEEKFSAERMVRDYFAKLYRFS